MYFRDSVPAKKTNREWFINSRARAAPNAPIDARNILRPETVESLFVAYRITGDPIYREWVCLLLPYSYLNPLWSRRGTGETDCRAGDWQGWEIFQAFNKHCRLPGGGFARSAL